MVGTAPFVFVRGEVKFLQNLSRISAARDHISKCHADRKILLFKIAFHFVQQAYSTESQDGYFIHLFLFFVTKAPRRSYCIFFFFFGLGGV